MSTRPGKAGPVACFPMSEYYVYILASRHHRQLSVGVTANLRLGVSNHRLRTAHRLSKKRVYQKLVRVEVHADLNGAVGRERYLKRLPQRSLELIINADNPTWAPISINALIRGDQQVSLSR